MSIPGMRYNQEIQLPMMPHDKANTTGTKGMTASPLRVCSHT